MVRGLAVPKDRHNNKALTLADEINAVEIQMDRSRGKHVWHGFVMRKTVMRRKHEEQ